LHCFRKIVILPAADYKSRNGLQKSKTMPKISIVIPVYNVEKYLAECLDSVLAQTLTDIEIICVNDGSPDRSAEILDEYARKDSRIVAVHQPNGGVSAARNAALDRVRGSYILFVDSDDTIHPQLCEKVYQAATRDDADLVFLFSDRGGPKKRDVFERIIRKNRRFSVQNQTLKENDMFISYCAPWTRLWKTAYLQAHHVRFPVGVCHSDTVVAWHGLLYSPVVSIVPESLYYYRENPDSLMLNPSLGNGRKIAQTMQCIKTAMMNAGLYVGEWKELFFRHKLLIMHWQYECIAPQFREEVLISIKNAIGEDEREYLRTTKGFSARVKEFYRMLDGSQAAAVRYAVRQALSKLEKTILRKTA
jgi:glycosyltransferase involved in cell wall biosynthesis